MEIITYEPENNLVQIDNGDGTESTIDYGTFSKMFFVSEGGAIYPKPMEVTETQREAMALAAEIMHRSYEPVFPHDPRPIEIRERVIHEPNPSEIAFVRAHSIALQMASTATGLTRSIKTIEYIQAARAAWCLNEALSADFDSERFGRFYLSYMEPTR